ncbi:hypothetical protein GW17_00043999 [Ensete ventricosum]|nr:hypothetical protein GW17_00043999 [Ensete ventricosum]
MDSFGVVTFPKYTAARNDRSSHSEHEKVFKKRIEEGEAKSLPSSSAKHMPIWGVGLTPWLRTKVVDPLTQIIGSFLNSDSYHLRFLLSSLVVPFVRLGEVISGGPHFPLTSDALKKVVTGEATRDVLISVLHAVILQLLGWVVAAPFILGALYAVFIPCFKFLIHRFNAAPESPKKQRAI